MSCKIVLFCNFCVYLSKLLIFLNFDTILFITNYQVVMGIFSKRDGILMGSRTKEHTLGSESLFHGPKTLSKVVFPETFSLCRDSGGRTVLSRMCPGARHAEPGANSYPFLKGLTHEIHHQHFFTKCVNSKMILNLLRRLRYFRTFQRQPTGVERCINRAVF